MDVTGNCVHTPLRAEFGPAHLFLPCACYARCCQQERSAGLNCSAPKPPAVFFLLYFSFLFQCDWNCNSSSGYSRCLCRQILQPSLSRRAVNCLQGVSLADQPVGVCTKRLHLALLGLQRCYWDCPGARTWAPWVLVIHCNSVCDKSLHLFCPWTGTWWTWHMLNTILMKDAFPSQGFSL